MSETIRANPGDVLHFRYRQWFGGTTEHRVQVVGLEFGKTSWTATPIWLLRALDLGRDETRLFAITGISEVQPGPSL